MCIRDRLSTRDEIVVAMPRFDRWGLLVEGREGEPENPLQAIPDTGSDGETEASTDAGESRDGEEISLKQRRLQISSSSDEVEEVFVTAPARRVDEEDNEDASEAQSEHRAEEEEARVETAGGSSSGPRGGDDASAI